MNREIELDIQDLSHDGRGVGRVDGKAVFVAGALAGERVRARLSVRKRNFDEGQAVEILRASPQRVAPKCAHFGHCGGCALQHLDPAAQIAAKQQVLLENLDRIGHVSPQRVLPALTAEPWGYRRKARLGVKWVKKKDKVLVGFREAADPRFIAELERCEVLVPQVGAHLRELAQLVESLQARERIAQIEVAVGDRRTALVFRNLDPLSADDQAKLVAFGRAKGIDIHLQPAGNDSVHALDGAPAMLEFDLPQYDLNIEFRPLDFVQVNAAMNQRMIPHALELLDLQPQHRVLDLFCGLGNFTLPIARSVQQVVGVEGEVGLVQRARDNARRNGLHNVEFHAADLGKPFQGEPWFGQPFDRLLLDPPRTGADGVIAQLPLAGIPRIVYVSCHPGSLARDAGLLVREHGYRLQTVGVMDMFPHTAHVESIALFERA